MGDRWSMQTKVFSTFLCKLLQFMTPVVCQTVIIMPCSQTRVFDETWKIYLIGSIQAIVITVA